MDEYILMVLFVLLLKRVRGFLTYASLLVHTTHVHQNKHRPNKNPRYSRATIYNDHPPLPGM